MHAIGHEVHERFPRKRVVYLTSEQFTNEVISSIATARMGEFRHKYRTVDVLLIDDVQFLAGKDRTKEEFFHTFNALHEINKQIVISSDRPPKEIPTLEDRLRSRFEWGLIADIQPPDLETKVAILRKKADERQIDLHQDAALFIAERVRTNIRELEGLLNRVVVYASMAGHKHLSLELTKEALKELLSKDNKPITPTEIMRVVAAHYGTTVTNLKSKSNAQTVAFPRQVAMYLCKHLTDLSYPEIGRVFNNKHHSTVMYSVEKIDEKMQNEPQFARVMDGLMKQFR